MCGINAIYRYAGINPGDRDALAGMNRDMIYRGPDDEGVWCGSQACLGMRRLSIIGVATGRQPLFNEDESLVLVCNGEIYNYRELKQDLQHRGHRFATDSDCEVIVHLYEEKGVACLDHLRGMFGLVLWDGRRQRLMAARDFVGEKPLYFSEIPGGVAFSSELKAIDRNLLARSDPDWNVIRQLMEYTYPVDLRQSFVKQIKRLLPGEYALVDQSGVRLRKYWKPRFEPTYSGSRQNAQEDLVNLLLESIRMRFMSEVPIAVMLSGGIDSSAVAVLAAASQREVHAITVGYRGAPACDERRMARDLAAQKGLIWHEIELDVEDFQTSFEEYTAVIDEPVADPVCIPQWSIYKKAKALGFTVLLNGTGGDELFFGYPYHNLTARQMETAGQLKGFLPLSDSKRSAFADFFSKQFFEFSQSQRYLFEDPLDHLKAFPDYWRRWPFQWPDRFDYRASNSQAAYLQEARNGYDQLAAILMATWLPANCLHISDKLGLGNGIEVRAPFLDHKLVEFTFSLPVEWRFSAAEPKSFLKQSLRGLVPDAILDAPKQGFTTPDDFLAGIVAESRNDFFNIPHHHFHTVLIEQLLLQHRRRWAPKADHFLHQDGHFENVSPGPAGDSTGNAKMATAQTYLQRGEVRYGQGDLPGARHQFELALTADDTRAVIHNNLGVLAWQEGRIKRAAACFIRALELAPEDPETQANCADMLAALDRRAPGDQIGPPALSQGSEPPVFKDLLGQLNRLI